MSSDPYLENVDIQIPQQVDGTTDVVTVTWSAGSRAPSFIEFYAAFNGAETTSPPSKLATGINPSSGNYSWPFDLSARPYIIYVAIAPRIGTIENPDDQMPDADGVLQPWESFQSNASAELFYSGSGGGSNLTAPIVAITAAYGTTLDQGPFFEVEVSAASGVNANNYNLQSQVGAIELAQQSSDNGYFTQVAEVAGTYLFSGQSHNQQPDGSFAWSSFSTPVQQESPPNYKSVAQFLQASEQLGAAGVTLPNVNVSNLMRQKNPPTLRGLLGF